MTRDQMGFWHMRFVTEARNRDETEYPPKSIYLIICEPLRFFKDNCVYDQHISLRKQQRAETISGNWLTQE